MHEVETYEHVGIPVVIYYDPEPTNPRTDWDHAATMVCWHRRSNLGDEQVRNGVLDSIEELIQDTVPTGAFVQPLWLYEHSGMTMTTNNNGNPFSCPWDSGQVGFIYISRDDVRKHMNRPRNYPIVKLAVDAANIMNGEVKEYDYYLRGECYGFRVAEGTKDEESVWGFLGDIEFCKSEANSMAEYIRERRDEQLTLAFSFA